MKKIALLLFVAMFLGGCINNQTIVIRPNVMGPNTAEGKGITVGLAVLDQRPTSVIGERAGYANITTNSDIVAIIRSRVASVLQDRGFTVLSGDANSPIHLTVQIRKLQFSSRKGFAVFETTIQASVRVVATRSGSSYKKMYLHKDVSHNMTAHGTSTNAQLINAALSNVLTQLADDQKLINFLTAG